MHKARRSKREISFELYNFERKPMEQFGKRAVFQRNSQVQIPFMDGTLESA